MDSNLTLEQIIKTLPFDALYKTDLLKVLPTLDMERMTQIEAIIRALYDSVFSLHYQRNLQLAISKLPPDTAVDEAFYQTVKQQTKSELESHQHAVIGRPEENISHIRGQLQQVMSENQNNK